MNVEDLINDVNNQDFGKAGPTFLEIMQTKMGDALEQEKISVAGSMFGQTSDDGEDDEDEDITDEDIEAELEDTD
tara:strand:- start:473 stop:697 length:225 start_codon:yes stop_codon:yes gene_type:complete